MQMNISMTMVNTITLNSQTQEKGTQTATKEAY